MISMNRSLLLSRRNRTKADDSIIDYALLTTWRIEASQIAMSLSSISAIRCITTSISFRVCRRSKTTLA